jgi:hypothetical protein
MSNMGRLAGIAFLLAAMLISPSQAQQAPKPSAQASSKAAAKTRAQVALPDAGSLTDGVYHNPFFGFSYKLPYGWVERTNDMQEGTEPGKSLVLLSIFERPPETTGDSINSAVVIAAESVSSYPGLKTAADYFGPLTELTTAKGFKVVNEPYDFSGGAHQLVRGDFSKRLGEMTMHQSSVVMLKKGYVVSFTFIGGSEDEVDGLIEKLSFGTPAKLPATRK